MIWQTSPAAAELEDRVLDWLRQMLGLPEGMAGVIQDTASTATLCALLSAREKATGFESNETGLKRRWPSTLRTRPTRASRRASRSPGFGRENLRLIPTDDDLRHDPREARGRPSPRTRPGGLAAGLRRRDDRDDLVHGRRSRCAAIGEIAGAARRLAPRRRRLRRHGRHPAREALDLSRAPSSWIPSSSTPTNGC